MSNPQSLAPEYSLPAEPQHEAPAPAAGEPAAVPAAPENLQVGTLAANIVDLDGPNNHIKFAHSKTRAYTIGLNGDASSISVANDQRLYTILLDGAKGDLFARNNITTGTLLATRVAANIVDLDGANNHIKFAHSKTRFYTVGISGDESKMSFANSSGRYTVVIDGQHGDIVLTNADCAEDFDVAADAHELAEPGTVMVIDDDGALRPSSQAYDSRVAGVISGAGIYQPAMVLDRQPGATGRAPLALIGKVFCKVDATMAPIVAGDLLTTSLVPGHAMKVADTARAVGATLGKALRSLSSGSALIPVLVTAR